MILSTTSMFFFIYIEADEPFDCFLLEVDCNKIIAVERISVLLRLINKTSDEGWSCFFLEQPLQHLLWGIKCRDNHQIDIV